MLWFFTFLLFLSACSAAEQIPPPLPASALRNPPGLTYTYRDWLQYESKHFLFSCDPKSPVAGRIRAHADTYDKTFEEISQVLGVQLNEKIRVYIYASSEAFRREEGGDMYSGRASGRLMEIHESPFIPPGHEMAHILADHIGSVYPEYPFLREGLAVYFEGSERQRRLHTIAKDYLTRKELTSLEPLKDRFRDLKPAMTYPVAGSFVKYLIDTYGLEKFKALWVSGLELEKAFSKVYGKSFRKVGQEWMDMLKNPSTIPSF
ncbi:MAG: hypothetical protein HY731_13840 [Candidatus Tectomicrobia bacterium]|nr:hypothetical protein [Candidatus Tectomicrobia bacterium]